MSWIFVQRVNMDILYVFSACMDMVPPPPNSQSFHQAEWLKIISTWDLIKVQYYLNGS